MLPDDYDEWDTEKLRIVLAHERSHVRQGDFYLQALAGLYAAIFWFSPLGWWLKRKLSDLSEAISDHAGLEEAAGHASYAQHPAGIRRPAAPRRGGRRHGSLRPYSRSALNACSMKTVSARHSRADAAGYGPRWCLFPRSCSRPPRSSGLRQRITLQQPVPRRVP